MEELISLLKTDTNVANAFGALASAAAAVLALFASCISVWISISSAKSQRQHNELSVRPLAEVTASDYEDCLRIKLKNNGTGPMIISAMTVSDGSNAHESIVEWMPKLPEGRAWNNFTNSLRSRTLSAGSELVLLELAEFEGERDFSSCRDIVREALASLSVNVEYTDIYGKIMQPYKRSLSWFARNL